MDIYFIKWMVGYADGFEYHSDDFEKWIITPNGDQWFLDHLVNNKDRYPLLLQRTIEGIEKNYDIEILAYWNKSGKCYESQVFDTEPLDIPLFKITYTDYKTIDQAKEQALKYVHEQEMNK